MKTNDLFRQKIKVLNVGSSVFLKDLEKQDIAYANLDWTPPARGDQELIEALDKLKKHQKEIDDANDIQTARVKAASAVWKDVKPAIEVIPGMVSNMIMHAGPPVDWKNMAGPQRGAVLGAVLFEGWADSIEEAVKYVENGNVIFSPNNEHQTVGPMAGITSPSMPVHVVYDPIHDRCAYCTINEGLGGVLRFGRNTPEVIERLHWIRKEMMPVLSEALHLCGGIDVRNIIAQALNMGDECHNRNKAATALLFRELVLPITRSSLPQSAKERVLGFVAGNEHFFLNLSMPYCKLAQMAGEDVPHSSIVSVMSRNGYEFGIKISGDNKWYVGPSQKIRGLFFPGYGDEDACPDIGDSCITETTGIGGFAMAASPAITKFVGGTVDDAFHYSSSMNEIAWSNNPLFTLPPLNFKPTALGIDIRKVVETGILPVINTGIAHKEAGIGQVGAGLVTPPFECFKQALLALARQFED